MMSRWFLAVALALSVGACADFGVKPGSGEVCQDAGEKINDDLDAASSYTFSVQKWGGYGILTNYITTVDDDASVTNLTMKCQGSRDDGATLYDMQVCEVASGVCTTFDASWSTDPAATATDRWIWRVDFEGVEDIKCTFTPTGGAATVDTLSVFVSACTKGG
jgi:hypothetical protein